MVTLLLPVDRFFHYSYRTGMGGLQPTAHKELTKILYNWDSYKYDHSNVCV